MTHETTLSLQREKLNLATALLACDNEKSRAEVKKLWKELVEMEFGSNLDSKKSEKDDLEQRMIQEYELMKSKTVKLARTEKGLTVTGLED